MSSPNNRATLLISCPDRRGLVAAISGLLSEHRINLIDAQQHTDEIEKQFFYRVYFDMSDMDVSREQLQQLLEIECGRFNMNWKLSFADKRKRVAIFVSKYEHCIYDLLLRHRMGELDCDIPLVISNHEDLRGFSEGFGIPYHVFPITPENKEAQEAREIELIRSENIDLIVMARYMQILSENMIATFPQQIINIHHSTLPAFKGAKPYHQAHDRGVKLVGATAHYATTDLDEGPILAQGVAECTHADSVDDLIRKGRDIERVTLANAVRAHLADRIIVAGRRTIIFR
ncbi:MAG: formyltetrahydrofolate deformylase [Pseudomonadales bacterium]|nr:formyltetrahydrofolate deformylase [Pseudomonadales bacterium]